MKWLLLDGGQYHVQGETQYPSDLAQSSDLDRLVLNRGARLRSPATGSISVNRLEVE